MRRPQGLYPHDDPFTATLQTLRESHAQFEGFGKTGEFTLARHQGDLIVFLLNHRHVELADRKEPCGRRRVGRLMEEMGLVAIQPRSFKPRTTDSRHTLGYSPNLLINAPPPDGINQIWVGDITYVPLVGGDFLYGSDGVGEDKATENGVPVPLLSVPTEEAETG